MRDSAGGGCFSLWPQQSREELVLKSVLTFISCIHPISYVVIFYLGAVIEFNFLPEIT